MYKTPPLGQDFPKGGAFMEIREIMTQPAISIHLDESAEVAARTLTHYNIGILPVCGKDGKICGLVTDRDLVTRCMASGKTPAQTKVREIMTTGVTSVTPNMEAGAAAQLMGSHQVRRLPVIENGILQGMVSLGDLAKRPESTDNAAGALTKISSNPADFEG